MANGASGDVFLMLPRVLLQGGASTDGFGVGGLGLPARTGTSKRRGRALKDYIANRGKASFIWDDVRARLGRAITFLGELRLGSPRY